MAVAAKKPIETHVPRAPLEVLEEVAHLRMIAISVGDIRNSVLREIARVMQEQGNSRVKSLQVGIDRLLQSGYISRPEAEDLNTISRLVLGTTRKNSDVSNAAVEVHDIYERMIISDTSSPVALAIASAANGALSTPQGVGRMAVAITPGSAGAGAVIGGIIGGVIGGLMGGPGGAAIGAAVGAAGGAAIGYCNE